MDVRNAERAFFLECTRRRRLFARRPLCSHPPVYVRRLKSKLIFTIAIFVAHGGSSMSEKPMSSPTQLRALYFMSILKVSNRPSMNLTVMPVF